MPVVNGIRLESVEIAFGPTSKLDRVSNGDLVSSHVMHALLALGCGSSVSVRPCVIICVVECQNTQSMTFL